MFTGIVEEQGTVVAMEALDEAARLVVRGPRAVSDAKEGDSVAINGVCLTVTSIDGDCFCADVMAETLRTSSLGELLPGSPVNLERPLTLQDRLGGHLVQGHVDGVATILERAPAEHWEVVTLSLPDHLSRYVVPKGSIAVDGVSLTVSALSDRTFEVSLIPTTLRATTLGSKPVGQRVNLEVDVLAKYVERMLAMSAGAPQSEPSDVESGSDK